MADYSTLLRDHVKLTCRSVDRSDLLAGVRAEAADGGLGVPVPALAAGIQDAFVSGVRLYR